MISMREAYEKIGANYYDACARLINTGISLPFFSYGGTSLLLLLGEMGVLLSISRAGNAREERMAEQHRAETDRMLHRTRYRRQKFQTRSFSIFRTTSKSMENIQSIWMYHRGPTPDSTVIRYTIGIGRPAMFSPPPIFRL